MPTLPTDLRYAFRLLRQQPLFTLAAVLTLALAIGANTAIFSVANAMLLRPLPYSAAERLVVLWGNFLELDIERLAAKASEYTAYRERTHSFDEVAASAGADYNLTVAGEPERLAGTRVTANLFAMLGARPQQGRVVLDEDTQEGHDAVVVLSHGLWKGRFGGAADVLGRTLRLNDRDFTVVGVMPAGFQYPQAGFPFGEPAQLWTPLVLSNELATGASPYTLNVLARLRPDVTLEQARADLATLARQLESEDRSYRGPNDADGGWRITATPLLEEVVGRSRVGLLVLLGAVALVLLIACANVANLLLVRASARQRELAIRAALGASRGRIVRHWLAESALLAALGGIGGVLLAWWGVGALRALQVEAVPRLSESSLDLRVLAFTGSISLLTGLIVGLFPAWQASRPDLQTVLREGGGTAARGRHRLRGLLVVVQVALAAMLLIGAGLLLQSLMRLQRVAPGVDVPKILFAELALPQARYAEAARVDTFYREAIGRIAALPGVERASAGSAVPLSGSVTSDPFAIDGRALDFSNPPLASWQLVAPRYFATLGIPLLRGRDFTERDTNEAAIVNQTLARKYWPGEDALGKRMSLGMPRADNPWRTVVGVVADTPHRGLGSPPGATWYLPLATRADRDARLFVRTAGDPAGLTAAVRQQIWAVDRDQPVLAITPLSDLVARSLAPRRFNTWLLGSFAALALLLAALGIYGVLAVTVTQRAREIGVRMALGAKGGDVVRLVVRHGLALVAGGLAIGLAAALAAARLLRSLLFGIEASDPLTLGAVATVLLFVALLACLVPAWRATRVTPLAALRPE